MNSATEYFNLICLSFSLFGSDSLLIPVIPAIPLIRAIRHSIRALYLRAQSHCLCLVSVLPQENLKIVGSEPSYDLNDKINLSCKSGDGRPYPQLNWFINDNMVRDVQQISRFFIALCCPLFVVRL